MLKTELLYHLEKYKGQIVTGGDLARQFHVSRTAVWKAINALRQEGNQIESLPNSGYRLLEQSDGLSEQCILEGLTTQTLGRAMLLLESVDSTNHYIRMQDASALPEGFTVIADEQTDGKGRLGRAFYSPAHEGIYMSILLKPRIALRQVPFLTLCTAVAVCLAVEKVTGAQVQIKWVNDIFYQGKKLCGILTEGVISAELGTVDHVVVGVGINTGNVAHEVTGIASSLRQTPGSPGIRNRLIAAVLNQLEPLYKDFLAGKKQPILRAYTDRLLMIGQTVTVKQPEGNFQATAAGVNEWGELLVQKANGEVIAVTASQIC